MNQVEQKNAAKAFVERWQAAEGNEQRESNSFWIELCVEVLGIPNPTHALSFERKVQGKRIDVFYEDMGILIENKSRGVDLDKQYERGKNEGGDARLVTPYAQAKWYADNMPRSQSPRWLITCNFDEIRIYDLEEELPEKSYETLLLEELPDLVHRLSFFTRRENSRLEREKKLSIEAGEVVGVLYDELSSRYHDIENSEEEQRSLNILITRIVFLLYAEDSNLLHEHQAFYNYLKGFSDEGTAPALKELFLVLKTPEEERGGLYVNDKAKEFPYINGGLFADEIIIPSFDADTRFTLLQKTSAEFDWKDISPTIFGAVFESTLNPETRRAGGMHYTSIENIHKVTGPLFYDALVAELAEIEGERQGQKREFKLKEFRDKLGQIKVLDPACGSGNFLTETYLGLRKLENRVLENLYGGETARLFQMDPIVVTLDQFYGIEINDFAVAVAKTALWIAELQMIEQTREIMNMWIEPLPLKTNDNIHCANALRMDWNDVLPASECNYIIGNPPFYGYTFQTEEQKVDVQNVFDGTGVSKKVDYVSCWYKKAIDYMGDHPMRAAFVSTNSICQGEQVPDLWKHFLDCGVSIDFAHTTFVWNSEAADQAHVHVVIVGFHKGAASSPALFLPDGERREATTINPYLVDAPVTLIESRSKPLCDVPPINKGSQPTDGGNLLIGSEEELRSLIEAEPGLEKHIRRFVGSEEFINDKRRFCFWLVDAPQQLIDESSILRERLEAVRQMRLASTKAQTRSAADTPALFTEIRQPDSDYILVPRVSSERRAYIPIGFLKPTTIASDSAQVIPNATLYHFGVLTSQFHNAWMRTVTGRLKSDYRYSNKIVYNNFVWPEPSEPQRQHIEWCAQQVLDARGNYPDKSLADLYDPDKMPSDLRQAHQGLDAAVEAAYGVNFDGDEEKIVSHLFKLYTEATKGE